MLFSIILVLQILTSFSTVTDLSSSNGDIIIKVENIQDIKGEILVGIYASKKTFRKVKKVYKYAVKAVENGREVLVIKDVPAGKYAIALFQDFNGNRKFDSNFMGIPKEPFGFSTNFIVKRRAPRFEEVTFDHDGSEKELTINIQVW